MMNVDGMTKEEALENISINDAIEMAYKSLSETLLTMDSIVTEVFGEDITRSFDESPKCVWEKAVMCTDKATLVMNAVKFIERRLLGHEPGRT